MKSITARLLAILPWSRDKTVAPAPAPAAAPDDTEAEPAAVEIAGSRAGWLRVLDADALLRHVHAHKALKKIWLQSRQSEAVFRRDFLPAIRAYAEFVQLMPASEAHHHAHVGGLLSHTLEMVLAALTWRNGHLLPEGEVIEVIDAQRDHWTYVVFFAALLHDVAKPMTDLRITWRTAHMDKPLRWAPLAGSLRQVAAGGQGAEYLVEFTPKAARDYAAHARLAQMLLPVIAPASAMAFLSTQPRALDALNLYLSGQDRDSLVAQLVRRADGLSAQRALQHGSQARFATAKAVPLIDLLMQAIGAMLRSGTSLPLNRSGAAGWVYDGAIWFVAKRLADATRDWIQKHEPDQTVPGETKNDRLFDTWQDYGYIERNPHSGQAIWHVTVHGQAADGQEQGAYTHTLSMLKFPLAKVFATAEHYPEPMRGYIEVRKSRDDASESAEPQAPEPEPVHTADLDDALAAAPGAESLATPDAPDLAQVPDDALSQPQTHKAETGEGRKRETAPGAKPAVKEPAFNKPKAAPPGKKEAATAKSHKAGAAQRAQEPVADPKPRPISAEDAAYLLDTPLVDAPVAERSSAAAPEPGPHETATVPATQANPRETGATSATPATHTRPLPAVPRLQPLQPLVARKPLQPRKNLPAVVLDKPTPMTARSSAVVAQNEAPRATPQTAANAQCEADTGPQPVILRPKLPKIAGTDAPAPPQPSQLALDFIEWLQQSLVDRALKFNETGAAVHFVPQGMALVSPLIFKLYAGTLTTETHKIPELAAQVQRAVIKAGWHMPGPNKTNIVRYAIKRGDQVVSHLSTVVLVDPGRFVQPVPPSNPVMELV